MASSTSIAHLFSVIILLPVIVLRGSSISAAETGRKKTYIVHMNHHEKPSSYATHHDWYAATLQFLPAAATESADGAGLGLGSPLLYTYTEAYHGFAASLSPEQAESLRRRSDSVLGVYEEPVYSLHTTRTPEFLGISSDLGLWDPHNAQGQNPAPQAAADVIIGVLDTGVWPESRSFDDSGMGAVPDTWRGECVAGSDFSPELCNRKLIGARYYSKGYRMVTGGSFLRKSEPESPRDQHGHGTHTASTAAGSQVANASLLGYASGTARGMATHARVASYKVCWSTGCFGSDILAAMDQAIADKVDVLSMSLGSGSAQYHRDMIAVGAFAAMERGILVSCSAGNSGPSRASVANVAPWIMTVGAGTLDRDFPAYVALGDESQFTGVSLYSGPGMGSKLVGLVYSTGATGRGNLCLPRSLDASLVRGKVVLCDRGINGRVEKGAVVRDAGGIGMILANLAANGEEVVADSHLLPTVAVGWKMGDAIRKYATSLPNPTAMLSFGGTVLNIRPSPVVAAFSSRGPNMVTPQILKPDVIGPGVNILAGWSEALGPTGLEKDARKTQFNIMSGTSMSCPHISGVAALLKADHPSWSPSAIKSALMTTAYTLDNTQSPLRDAADGTFSTPWAHGSGHVDPQRALFPGLVYDISSDDYIAFLCSLDYTLEHIKAIAKRPDVNCSRRLSDPGDLNYPSFSILFRDNKVVKYTREVTNVGPAVSTYELAVTGPPMVEVTVKPKKLVFTKAGEKLRYRVTFASKGTNRRNRSDFGSIVWSDGQNQVRSPIAYAWTQL
ncbi:hypothetical protein SAY87_006764 [Trapa incisa]|uniref:Subtilisin-like protease SBT1.8 n=1 Tax=Trapa incisa TaxID=236973 RepID=A0AAN7K1L7_9MYRT|nr:hypothetical protein SAY87_006764 [Trapa incisa]